MTLFTVLSVSASEGFLQIGAPSKGGLKPKGAEIVLVSFKVIECLDDEASAKTKVKGNVLAKHDACINKARVLYAEKASMAAGTNKKFESTREVPYIITVPDIRLEKGKYTISTKTERQSYDQTNTLVLSLSKVVSDHVLASLHATVENASTKETVARLGQGEVFYNPNIIPEKRLVTSSQKFKLGETHILGGDMWLEEVVEEKIDRHLPENKRLWVELSIK